MSAILRNLMMIASAGWCSVMMHTLVLAQDSATTEIEIPATVHADQVADLFAKVGGYLDEVLVDIGSKVAEDEVLATIKIPEMETELQQKQSLVVSAQAEFAQAQAAVDAAESNVASAQARVREAETMLQQKNALLKFARQDVNRVSSLVSSGAVNRELLDAASFKLASAEAELVSAEAHIDTAKAGLAASRSEVRKAEADRDSAQAKIKVAELNRDYVIEMLKYATIRAPFPGQITKRWFDKGAFIQSANGNSAARPILQLVDTRKMRIVANLSMSQIRDLTIGDSATLYRIDALPDQEFTGTITRFSAGMDQESRMMRVEMDIENPDGHLKPGFYGYMRITTNR